MKDLNELKQFILENADDGLVLCTLVRKTGSSYRHVGSKKVVGPQDSRGLLSGGCLEGSIEKSARERQHDMPFIESFSTLADEDRLLGYQTGCQGVIDILFERIPIPGFEMDRKAWFEKLDLMIPFGAKRPAWGVAVELAGVNLGKREFVGPKFAPQPHQDILIEEWSEPLHLVVIGCGPDADPYLPLARSLGWSVEFMDYRRSFADPGRFPGAHAVTCLPLSRLTDQVPQGNRVAVVLMTHNYEADLEIMRGLRCHHLGYLGCLGPARRYEQIKKDMLDLHGEIISEHLQAVVSAPMGIFTNSNSPEVIALSAVAQIQETLIERSQDRVWSLILAAGASKRFGSAKALAPWQEGTLLSRALASCKEVSGSSTMVVTGGWAENVLPALDESVLSIHNPNWQQGMGSSIACGVSAILRKDPKAKFIVILPVDQPFADVFHLKKLIQESQRTGRCVLTEGQGFLGPPAALPQNLFAKALALNEDRGLKKGLSPSEITAVKNVVAAQDVDSPDELVRYGEASSS